MIEASKLSHGQAEAEASKPSKAGLGRGLSQARHQSRGGIEATLKAFGLVATSTSLTASMQTPPKSITASPFLVIDVEDQQGDGI
jgi:hypothetical protein